MTTLCLYLPNVSPDYKYRDIKNIFMKYNFGTINYINIVKTEFPYNRVFIDFNICSCNLLEKFVSSFSECINMRKPFDLSLNFALEVEEMEL